MVAVCLLLQCATICVRPLKITISDEVGWKFPSDHTAIQAKELARHEDEV